MHDRKSDGFAQRLLIRPPEHRATKKPLLAGYHTCSVPFFFLRVVGGGGGQGGETVPLVKAIYAIICIFLISSKNKVYIFTIKFFICLHVVN